MPTSGLPRSRCLTIFPLLLLAALSATPLSARHPNPAKYPLRVHVLVADQGHRTPRMNPGLAASCDSVDGMLTSLGADSGGPVTLTGFGGDPCAIGPDFMRGGMLDNSDDSPAFSGAGRGDLVSPPNRTQALTFQYDNCSRVRVHPGFYSLPARWRKPGRKLDVLIPSDAIPVPGHPLAPVRCTFSVAMHDFVYLLLRNGSLVEVSEDVYWAKPGLRVFLSGNTAAIKPRPAQYTVPAHPTN